ncbi:MAG: hypothetical protein AB7O44_12855 [Hyphomicrobiaceae bacterium]
MPSTLPRQRTWIPEKLKPYFGNRASHSEQLHGVVADARSIRRAKRDAEWRHHRLFHAVNALPNHVKAMIIENGGDVCKLGDRIAEVRELLTRLPDISSIMFVPVQAPADLAGC